ncbi:type II toxin-antitoxin system RelE/ParE family toxin [Ilumatobacter nonamiensis]|uniref:type II toxin-antitoxin system RelE/ParE family toxin n=1 Tax=Ilumatobacter nonamiensis TaxID=467093 RepID=UPI000345A1D8
MSRAVRFDPAARLETLEAAEWYDEQRAGLGEEFLHAIDRTIDLARRRRVPGAPVARLEDLEDVRRLPILRFPYQLVITVSADELVIVAVMHERRRPAYWIDRLDE